MSYRHCKGCNKILDNRREIKEEFWCCHILYYKLEEERFDF